MLNIIDFIERMGQDARLRHASRNEMECYLQDAGISPELRAAFFAADQRRIESLLGLDTNVCCLIYMPKETPDVEESPGKINEPAPDEELIPAYTNLRRSASSA
jgi:hypothetical protein